jgi:O-antigen ligase
MPRKATHAEWIEPAALVVFGLACLTLGGSSRPMAHTPLALRPIVVCCIMVFAWRMTRMQLITVRIPLLLLGAFALTIAIQLVPIPASIWPALQGRTPYAENLAALALPPRAHPLSLTPDRTWNSLIALIVPLAMLLGYAATGRSTRALLLPALIAGGMASAVLGVAQLAAGPDSALFFYDATNSDNPVGFFANRNHEAAFLVIMFPALRAWSLAGRSDAARQRHTARMATPRTFVALGIGIFLVPMILATGSRAGFVLMLLGLLAAYAIAPVPLPRPKRAIERWAILAGLAGLILIVIVTLASGRAVSLQRVLASNDVSSDLRLAYMPTMLSLIGRFWIFGSGFGSFDPVLRGSEPDSLLHGRYFNNAHNELIELVMTGGLPATLVLLAFLAWWGRTAFATFRHPASSETYRARAAAFMIGLLLLASLLDYPIRTPLISAVLTLLCIWLTSPAPGLPVARMQSES